MTALIQRIIASPAVHIAEGTDAQVPPEASLFPSEEAAVTRARIKRKKEFTIGRHLARRALGALSFTMNNSEIPMGEDRAPCWPNGIVGAISHCNGWAAAAVGRCSEVALLGIDVERDRAVNDGLRAMVCTAQELEWVDAHDSAQQNMAALTIFSAKESLYKALYPQTNCFLGFHSAVIEFDAPLGGSGTWCGILHKDWGQFCQSQRFNGGRYLLQSSFIATTYIELV